MKLPKGSVEKLARDGRVWLAASLGVGVAGMGYSYARFVEPHWLEVSYHRLAVADLELGEQWRGYKVAFLSDLHIEQSGPLLPVLQAAIERVLQEQPNLVLMGGDYFTRGVWNPQMGQLLRQLTQAGLRVVGVMGDHDYFGRRKDPDRIVTGFEEAGACMLVNKAVPLEYNGQREWLAALDDARKGDPSLDDIAVDLPDGVRPLIFLSHNPDFINKLPPRYCRIMLSGHTHGGQINLALPPLHERLNWIKFTRTQHRSDFPLGWYNINGNRLYVGRGLGLSGWQLRFNARPELPIIELV